MRPSNLIINYFSPKTIYRAASIFPMISVLVCWICYYALGHFKKGRIRNISETVLLLPESRIFAVTMSIESCILLFIFYIRQRLIHKIAIKNSAFKENFKTNHYISSALIPVMIIGLCTLADITLVENRIVHLSAAFAFFFGMLVYLCISDNLAKIVGFTISSFSRALPYVCLVLATLYAIITIFIWRNRTIYSIGSLFQYTVAFLIFYKIGLLAEETPDHTILNGNEQKKFE